MASPVKKRTFFYSTAEAILKCLWQNSISLSFHAAGNWKTAYKILCFCSVKLSQSKAGCTLQYNHGVAVFGQHLQHGVP